MKVFASLRSTYSTFNVSYMLGMKCRVDICMVLDYDVIYTGSPYPFPLPCLGVKLDLLLDSF